MKHMYQFTATLFIAFLFLVSTNSAFAQTTYDSKTFGDCEVIEAALGNSGTQFSIYIAEHELRSGYGGAYERSRGRNAEEDNLDDLPPNKEIIIEVMVPGGLKFPIVPEDTFRIAYSTIQHELGLYQETKAAADAINQPALDAEVNQLNNQKVDIESQARDIAMKMASGQISYEEGQKQIEALTNAATALIDNADLPGTPDIGNEDPTTHNIVFTDSGEGIEANIFSGTLEVIRFNEAVFEARFTGQHMVGCLEKRAARSKEAQEDCQRRNSSLVQGTKVLDEGSVSFTIKVDLKKFDDFR
ncbi:MAG: hypothetical protein AAF598_14620 [Bacteroidota bacterium]